MNAIFEKYGCELTGSRLYGIPNDKSDWDFDITVDNCRKHREELEALGFDFEELELAVSNQIARTNPEYSDTSLIVSMKTEIKDTTVNLLVVQTGLMQSRRKFRESMLSFPKEFIVYLYGMAKEYRKPFFHGLIRTITYHDTLHLRPNGSVF